MLYPKNQKNLKFRKIWGFIYLMAYLTGVWYNIHAVETVSEVFNKKELLFIIYFT